MVIGRSYVAGYVDFLPVGGPLLEFTRIQKSPGENGNFWRLWLLLENMVTLGENGNSWRIWKLLVNMVTFGKNGNSWRTWQLLESMVTFGENGNSWAIMVTLGEYGKYGNS
jgi:hypothetical protein